MLIWTGQQLSPDAPIYNMAFRFQFTGAIDVQLFQTAVTQLVESSDSLRSVIEMQDGIPFQRVLDSVAFEPGFHDFSSHRDSLDFACQWCDQQCRKSFDISKRMFDSSLLRINDDTHIWYLCIHHLISDAIAFQVALNRLNSIYTALIDKDNTLESLPAFPQFIDYVEFEKSNPRQSSIPSSVESGESNTQPLPTFYGKSASGDSWKSTRVTCQTDKECLQRFHDLTKRKAARSISTALGEFNLYATAFLAFLHRVSGQNRLTIGAPFHNRGNSNFKKTIGLFVEVFPLSVTIDNDETYLSLLQKVKTATNVYLKQATTVTPATTASYNAVFNFIPTFFGEFNRLPVKAEWLHPAGSDRHHPIRLHVQQFAADQAPTVKFDLNDSLFNEQESNRVCEHFNTILNAMSSNWDSTIAEEPLVSKEELNWQDSFLKGDITEGLPNKHVLDLFSEQVKSDPAAIAITCGDSKTTFAELNHWSNRIAQAIIATRTGQADDTENPVAVAIDRSPEFVAAILGVLKADAPFIPVDPDWPAKRIDSVVNQAGATLALVNKDDSIQIPVRLTQLNIDSIESTEHLEARCTVSSQSDPIRRLAYILFTSGSTGQPKGVQISHRSLANYAQWARQYYCGRDRLSFPLFTPTTFDLTITSIFVPLISGGTIVVYPRTNATADTALLDVLREDRVDIIKMTPAHLGLIQDQSLTSTRVQQLILGGENLTTSTARNLLRVFPNTASNPVKIHNEYGPTEATVGCIVHTFAPQQDTGSSVPIGRPIANMSALILDSELNRVPTGVPGQLYLTGCGLADGYAGQPELTADRFVPNPFHEGQRIYRTGDLARLNRDGQIEFLGRVDEQVKILGARIELQEVEQVLQQLDGVNESVAGVFQLQSQQTENLQHCERCGLPSNYPDTTFESGICNQCRSFDKYQQRAETWFQPMDKFRSLFDSKTNESEFDCLALLSGGKDSTYMVSRLADMGLRVLAFTLDNGFISEGAKANIRRVVETLGIQHVFGSTDSMNEIFVDSLKRHSNVCHGCFKTIYTLSTHLAIEKGIPFIVTGLSRGQFFETRLTEALFTDPDIDADQIDQVVLDARRAYHRIDDAVSKCLDVDFLKRDETFQKVQYLDFYRYCSVNLDEMYEYLDRRLPWVRPSDTGRSTNCLINDTGIYVHKKQRGFHNYALPYSWDVRLGHKTRKAAMQELDDNIDVENVHRILQQIGYDGDLNTDSTDRLVAWYASDDEIPKQVLRQHLQQHLPNYMIPAHFVHLPRLPLNSNGKIDRAALPDPIWQRAETTTKFVEATTETEKQLTDIWTSVLGQSRIGIQDNFFELGGDSILAIQIVSKCNQQGIRLQPGDLFDTPTIAGLALRCLETALEKPKTIPTETPGPFPPTPIQRWYFQHKLTANDFWNQSVVVQLPNFVTEESLGECLNYLANFHDAFRQRFHFADDLNAETVAETVADPNPVPLRSLQLARDDTESRQAAEQELHQSIDLESGILLAGLVVEIDGERELLLVANHLAVDAVSWNLLLDQLDHLLSQHHDDQTLDLPRAMSYRNWAKALQQHSQSEVVTSQQQYWSQQMSLPVFEPSNHDYRGKAGDLLTIRKTIDSTVTRRLVDETAGLAKSTVEELLLAAIFRALAQTRTSEDPNQHLRLFVERHGRENFGASIDPSQTVGWFISIFPITLACDSNWSVAATVKSVKESVRQVPDKGLGYGLLTSENNQVPRSGILFNYLGRIDNPIGSSDSVQHLSVRRALQLHRSDSCPILFPWQINCWIERAELNLVIEFDRRNNDLLEMQPFTEAIAACIMELLNAETWSKGETAVASDFPLANLNQKEFGKLSALLGKKDKGNGAE